VIVPFPKSGFFFAKRIIFKDLSGLPNVEDLNCNL